MKDIGRVYGEALYELAKEARLTRDIGRQLTVLGDCFRREPDFLRLLSSPGLTRAERRQVLEDCFRGRVHPYLLNFLMLLTEQGHIRRFDRCRDAYEKRLDREGGILKVTAVTAVALTATQEDKLTATLSRITGKTIRLCSRIDPSCLGGVRLDFDGQRLEDTIASRLDRMGMLLNTAGF